MINRSLIRIKTVQILYSYLLTRTDFKLEAAPLPGEASRDSQFAYSVYLDMLALLLKLSGIPLGKDSGITISSDAALKKNRVGKSLKDDSAVAAVLNSHRKELAKFDESLPELLAAITSSAVYKDYSRKRKHEMADDVQFWNTIFATVVRKAKGVEQILRKEESFTLKGFERGIKMLANTLSTFDDTRASYLKARRDLDRSLTMAYNLYHALLALPVHITELQAQRLDANKNKYLPTAEDLNPDTRFVDNTFVAALRDCEELTAYISDNPEADPSMWRDNDLLFAALLDKITASELYAEYMAQPAGGFAADAAFWREVMRTIIVPSDELAEALEAKSVYWNDDLAIMSTFVLKTIRRSYDSGTVELLAKFMNADDEAFGSQLFEYVVQNRDTYRSYIYRFIDTAQWDPERLAFMDIVIMMTAIAEIINYPSIPVPVTLNEYIEVANDYSTMRSGQFINGILYSVIKMLNEEGIIMKN